MSQARGRGGGFDVPIARQSDGAWPRVYWGARGGATMEEQVQSGAADAALEAEETPERSDEEAGLGDAGKSQGGYFDPDPKP